VSDQDRRLFEANARKRINLMLGFMNVRCGRSMRETAIAACVHGLGNDQDAQLTGLREALDEAARLLDELTTALAAERAKTARPPAQVTNT
jgi:hypothetical protein